MNLDSRRLQAVDENTWERNRQELADYEAQLRILFNELNDNSTLFDEKLEISKQTILQLIDSLKNLKKELNKNNNIYTLIKQAASVISLASSFLGRVGSGITKVGCGFTKMAADKMKKNMMKDNAEQFDDFLRKALQELEKMRGIANIHISMSNRLKTILKSLREESCLNPFLTFDQATAIVDGMKSFNRFIRCLASFPQVIDPRIQEALLLFNNILIIVIEKNYEVINDICTFLSNNISSSALDMVLGTSILLVPDDGVLALKGLSAVIDLYSLIKNSKEDADIKKLEDKIDGAIEALDEDLSKIPKIRNGIDVEFKNNLEHVLNALTMIITTYQDHPHLIELLHSDAMARAISCIEKEDIMMVD